MSKVITLRLSEDEYKQISTTAHIEHRTISNFITVAALNQIDETCYTDAVETAQILSDKKLLQKLKAGHADAKKLRGRFVG
jgi:uncharacterized protein (DUF1778 family)